METETERYERYLKQNKFWFASCPAMERFGEEQEKLGNLKRLWELIPVLKDKDEFGYKTTWAYTWVPKSWSIHDLPQVFNLEFLVDCFGLFELAPDYQI